tara:strand:- start:190 stop:627 length:438 start_codon:yes stop_codon:yes gene_type:complete
MIEGGSNNKGSKERLETPPIISTTFRRFVIMKNYLNTYKTNITSCNLWRDLDRAILPLHHVELGSILITPRLFCRAGYLTTSIYNQTDNYLSVMLPKYQALLSSLCFVPMIQTPFGKNLNVKPQKYISAKRFNKLNYKTINNKCK